MPSGFDAELSRLQKNARNKLYRLRKRGASNAVIGAMAVPVRSAREVAAMTPVQKRSYASQLKAFNARENAYEFLGSRGEEHILQKGSSKAVPAAELWDYRIREAEANIFKRDVRKQLESVRSQYLGSITDVSEYEEALAAEAWRSSDASRFSVLADIVRNVPFESMGALERAVERAAGVPEHFSGVRNRERYMNWRESIVNRLRENDNEEAARIVSELTPEQLDYLHYYTDFSELTQQFYYEADLTSKGIQTLAPDALAAIASEVSMLAARAKNIKAAYTV